jgi:hypothetical protein
MTIYIGHGKIEYVRNMFSPLYVTSKKMVFKNAFQFNISTSDYLVLCFSITLYHHNKETVFLINVLPSMPY